MNNQTNILPAHFFLTTHNYERYLNQMQKTQVTEKQKTNKLFALPVQPTKITLWDMQIKILRFPKERQSKYFKGVIQEARTIAKQAGKKIEDVEFTINEHGIVTHSINA